MLVFAVSGGAGAGKTRLATLLVGPFNVRRVSSKGVAGLAAHLSHKVVGFSRVAVDDIRSLEDVRYLRERFPGNVVHFHIATRDFDQLETAELELALAADYAVTREGA